MIGICGKEGARIWYVKTAALTDTVLQVLKVIDLFDSISKEVVEVWKISWNVMASLVTTADSNEITIFKTTGIGKWEKIKSIKENQVSE